MSILTHFFFKTAEIEPKLVLSLLKCIAPFFKMVVLGTGFLKNEATWGFNMKISHEARIMVNFGIKAKIKIL